MNLRTVATAIAVVGVLGLLIAIPAVALSTPLAKVRAYQVSCTTTAGGVSLVDTTPGGVSSLTVWINSATPVYIGGADIDATHGMPFCTTTADCPASYVSIDVKEARCLSSSGTVTATVLAGTM